MDVHARSTVHTCRFSESNTFWPVSVQLWHDSVQSVYQQLDKSERWATTRVAYCASNIIADEQSVFVVVARRTTLGAASAADFSVSMQYSLYSRTSRDGSVLWAQSIGTVPSPASMLPDTGSADAQNLLQPFALTVSADRRLIIKYDDSVVDSSSAVGAVTLRTFQCATPYPTVYEWVLLVLAGFISVAVARLGLGLLQACVRIQTKPSGRLLASMREAASDAALPAPAPGRGAAQRPSTRGRGARNAESATRSPRASPSATKSRNRSSSRGSGSSNRDRSSSRSTGSSPRPGTERMHRESSRGSLSSLTRAADKEGAYGYVTHLSRGPTDSASGAQSPSRSRGASKNSSDMPSQQRDAPSSVLRPPSDLSQTSSPRQPANMAVSPGRTLEFDDIDDYCTVDVAGCVMRELRLLWQRMWPAAAAAQAVDAVAPTRSPSSAKSTVDLLDAFDAAEAPTVTAGAPAVFRGAMCSGARARMTSMCRHPGLGSALLSISHYVVVLLMLSLATQGAQNAVLQLRQELSTPVAFYNSYLINRSPDAKSTCVSDAAAACYCTRGSWNAVEQMPLPRCNASYPAVQYCDYDVTACARPCSQVLQETGNCAASVFQYDCTCASDCTGTQFNSNFTFRQDGFGGLPAGLQACDDHYSSILFLLQIGYISNVLVGVLALAVIVRMDTCAARVFLWSFATGLGWYYQKMAPGTSASDPARPQSGRPSSGSGDMLSVTPMAGTPHAPPPIRSPDGLLAVTALTPSPASRRSRTASFAAALLSPGTRSSTRRDPTADGIPGQMSSTTRSFVTKPSAAALVRANRMSIASPNGGGAAAAAQRGPTGPEPAQSAAERRYAMLHGGDPDHENRSRGVGILVFLAVCQAGVFVSCFMWMYFLILQGRYCTGADGDGSGRGLPLVGNDIPPQDSLILRYVPGCSFGSAWQDVDLEGTVLRSVWLGLASQVIGVMLLFLDQGLALLFACSNYCTAIVRTRGYRSQPRSAGCCGAFMRFLGRIDSSKLFAADVWLEVLGVRQYVCNCRPRGRKMVADAEQENAPLVTTAAAANSRGALHALRLWCGNHMLVIGWPCCGCVIGSVDDEEDFIVHADADLNGDADVVAAASDASTV